MSNHNFSAPAPLTFCIFCTLASFFCARKISKNIKIQRFFKKNGNFSWKLGFRNSHRGVPQTALKIRFYGIFGFFGPNHNFLDWAPLTFCIFLVLVPTLLFIFKIAHLLDVETSRRDLKKSNLSIPSEQKWPLSSPYMTKTMPFASKATQHRQMNPKAPPTEYVKSG